MYNKPLEPAKTTGGSAKIVGVIEMEQLNFFETYGVPNERYYMAPKWTKFWADQMGVSVSKYLDIYEAEIAYEAKITQQTNSANAKSRTVDF